jgi:HemY protein
MKRLLGFLFRAAVFVVLAAWLADRPGTARIVWHEYVIESSAAVLGLAVIVLAFVFYLLFRLWHMLRHGPELWRLGNKLKKLQQGQDLLAQGMAAVAGGDAAEAGRLALAARKKLGTTTATLLLQAQAAQLAHDRRTARAIFRAMLEDPASAVLGYRGLIMEARRAGEWSEVERLAAEVERLKPDIPWCDLVRFEGAVRRQAWEEAGASLARLAPTRLLESDALRRNRAALLIARSQEEAKQGNAAAALELAEDAAKQAPSWLPALINLAERQAAGPYGRAARRTAERGWAIQPHPRLAAAFKSGDQDLIAHYKQLERLCRDTDNDPASRMVLAEAAVAADIWGEARRHLMYLVSQKQATQGAYRLLARLERRESGDEKAYAQWLAKAAEALPDPAWLCSTCGAAHEDWQATCRSCDAFATLEWQRPGAGHTSARAPVSLLSDWS